MRESVELSLTVLALIVASVATVVAISAGRAVVRLRADLTELAATVKSPPQRFEDMMRDGRALVEEMDGVLEKWSTRIAREAKRRAAKAAPVEEESTEPPAPPAPTDPKGELWAIVHGRGIAPLARRGA